MLPCFTTSGSEALPLWTVTADGYPAWRESRSEVAKAWLEGSGFEPKPGATALSPGDGGRPAGAVVVLSA